MSFTDQQSIITQVVREECEQVKSPNTTDKGKLYTSVPPLQNVNRAGRAVKKSSVLAKNVSSYE